MTEDKARKRAVRSRMAKTRESYTAARRHVVKSAPISPAPVDTTELGKSNEAIEKGSGKGWSEWFEVLDGWGATERTHGEIASYVHDEHGVPGWWAQTVAVGYERGSGMREKYQNSDGFSVTVSKTFHVGVKRLFEEFTDTHKRARWLESGTLRIRTSQPGKSARFDFRDGGSRVHVYFLTKGRTKATVHVQHERLADREAVEETRAFWKERLARIAEKLGP